MNWPIYKKDNLVTGSKESNVGIITLWTKKEKILKYLDKKDFAAIGQLYSKYEGISYLMRNCLANKKIRYLIIVGKDLSGSGELLKKIFGKKVNIKGVIHEEIPLSSMNDLRKNVKLLDYRELKDFSKLKKIINDLEELPNYGSPEHFPEPKINIPSRYPSEENVFLVRQKNIGDAWLKALRNIIRFGYHKKTEDGGEQLELINLVTVTDEDINNLSFKKYYLFTREELNNYFPQILTSNSFEGVEYTYGQRLRNYKSIDQIEELIKKIKKNKNTRRAVGIIWNVLKDLKSSKAPCINLIQAIIQENKLFLTAYIRSNDIFKAWPLNAYGLRKLQRMMSEKIGAGVGTLTTISNSAHIYKSDLEKAKKILKENKISAERTNDSRGDFIIEVKKNKIIVVQQDKKGKPLKKYEGKNAKELCEKIVFNSGISSIYHATYLGRELKKAEYCIKYGEEYIQD